MKGFIPRAGALSNFAEQSQNGNFLSWLDSRSAVGITVQRSNKEDPSLACPEKVDKVNSIWWSSFSIHCTGQHHCPCEIGYFVCSACVDMVGFVASVMLYYDVTKIILR